MCIFLTILVCNDNNGWTAYTEEFAHSLHLKSIISVLCQICQANEQLINRQSQHMSFNSIRIIAEFVVNDSVLSQNSCYHFWRNRRPLDVNGC